MKEDENTNSQTDTMGVDAPGGAKDAVRLLGSRDLRVKEPPTALLRLRRGILDSVLAQKIGMESMKAAGPLVLGPLSVHEIRILAEQGMLESQDEVIVSFDRWKTVRSLFPGLSEFREDGDEFTQTATATATATRGTFGEDEGQEDGASGTMMTPTPSGVLELEAGMPTPLPVPSPRAPAQALPLGKTPAPKPTPAAPKFSPPSPTLQRDPAPSAASASKKPERRTFPTLMTAVVVAILGAGFWFLGGGKESFQPAPALEAPGQDSRKEAMERHWPASLQPRPASALVPQETPLLAKLRPILSDYERGQILLDPSKREILRAAADPASGSFEARKIAANQLAVYLLAEGQTAEAKNLLRPISEAARTDSTTLFNMALIALADDDFAQARQYAESAVGHCPAGLCWLAEALMGMVEGYSGRLDAAEPHFRRAASLTSNNLIVPGLWLQAFVRNRTTADMRIALLIRDALLFDPDRLLDSPIPAPIAGHVLAKEAMSGLSRASELTIARLSSGQKAFLRWLEGRIGRNPLSQPLGSVLEQLALEADPVSQVLYAYALRDRGSLDQASQVLSRVLPLLDSQKGMLSSSWPWTYSGDVQFALGRFDAAVVSYQSAQTRNNADPGALLGMALIFRERGNFPQAESQLGEALRADPFFIPAVLRLSRFEWQAQALQR